MKRFWLVLLSLGLIMAFSVSAFAVDVKVSGEYYAAGLALNKIYLADVDENQSTAFFYQRLRIGTDFIVSPCLKLVTRFDAMEREWGARGITSYDQEMQAFYNTKVDQENIEFDIAYIDYTSPIGLFRVGYMTDYSWGTIWGNKESGPTSGQIKYIVPIGPVYIVFDYAKEKDNSASAITGATDYTDRDYDSWRIGGIYNFKGSNVAGEAGALFIFNHDAEFRGSSFNVKAYSIQPYFKAKVGPLALQGEINYLWGNMMQFEDGLGDLADKRFDSLSVWLDGDATFGMFSVGGSFAYVQGDDDANDNVVHNYITGGRDWDPCLIMFNNNTAADWVGTSLVGYSGGRAIDGEMTNAWFGQLRAGVTPVPQFTAGMSVSFAAADKKPANWAGSNYGWEVDVTGTYKITNNLSYMLGVGYLFTGDYFKGTDGNNEITNDYMLINKLTLSF